MTNRIRTLKGGVGLILDIEVDDNGFGWSKFMRVRVEVDLTKPLARRRMLTMGEKQLRIPFKYESRPIFCFNCGVIKHFTFSVQI